MVKKSETKVPKTAEKKVKKAVSKTAKLKNIKKSAAVDKVFVLADGNTITSLMDLALNVDQMHDHLFYHHVNEERNDFSNWIKDVFEEIELAESLMNAKEKKDFQIKMLKHIINFM